MNSELNRAEKCCAVATVQQFVSQFSCVGQPTSSGTPLAPMWPFATLGSASGNVGNILLLILLLYVFALLLQDRPALLIVSISTAILSLSLILAGAAFSLDAMQLRSRIDAQVVQRFDIASAEAIVKFIAQGIVSALLSLSALRSWRLLTREFHRDERPSQEMVVVPGSPSRTA